MKIIILGAGQVGSGLAEYLINENNEIVVIDNDIEKLEAMQNRYDIQIVKGYGSHPKTLRDAGASNAELLVAVTDSDEINMLACQLGYSLYHIPQKIARIRNHEYLAESSIIFNNSAIPIDHIIAPEQLITKEIVNLIEYPGAIQIADFAQERIAIVAVKAYYGGPLVGYQVGNLRNYLPNVPARIIGIFRQGRPLLTTANTVIEAGDEIFFVSANGHIRNVMSGLQKIEDQYKRIMIVGGNNIGKELAHALTPRYNVKLIDTNLENASQLAEEFDKTNVEVYCSDPSNPDFLMEEHIDKIDLIVCVTDNDETNIMSALLAKKLGTKKSIVQISKFAYISLIQNDGIDVVISPQEATISALLTNMRHNGVETVHSLRRGQAEGLEIKLYGDKKHSKVIGKKINEISLPNGVTIAAIYRDDEIFIANGDFELKENDLVIFFVTEKRYVKELIKLTTPKATYFLNKSTENEANNI
ncbi:MAG: Trk system potassium transporter TrkA [Succinivibrionaceae bacterium]|nr:Trk system potassium transporter TrkA [Ruminobacter sp.]MDY5778423.1 Trk system potassium transporter TrkA [Succinivibrionaceae bacterium]MEE1339559.1 Trk system potassium transporter TrkA [Succinivibrionaceae bacterium]